MTPDTITGRLGRYSLHEDPTLLDEAADLIIELRRALAASEADADRLAGVLYAAPEMWSEDMDIGSLLDLHDEAVARRSQP